MSTLLSTLPTRPSLRMTEPEFVAWSKDDVSAEWVDGEVVLKMPVDENHDELQALIRSVVELFVKRRSLGKVRGPEFTTRLTLPGKTVRRDPDVMFIANATLPKLRPTLLDGPPDVAFEVVAPETEFRDFHQKYTEYEDAGVREYWIVSPSSKQVYLFVRNDDTRKFERREADAGARYLSSVIEGLWFKSADLFAAERADAVTLLKAIDPTLI
ncbi:MAG: Uma2 family endonuclease [Tepidisphaeraceae bacterium]